MATIGIVGLGLIGGSLLKAFAKYNAEHAEKNRLFGYDLDSKIIETARENGELKDALDDASLGACDLLLLAVYPAAAIQYLQKYAEKLSPNCIVVDCCGTKTTVCEVGFSLAKQYGFSFVGGHPMAGTHHSGYQAATADLFRGANMVLVPPSVDGTSLLPKIKQFLSPVGFGRFTVMTAAEHDRLIAFTSQLAHVVSNAYVKSPSATKHSDCSAGSYRDLTRVAALNPTMWTELFLENRGPLLEEIRYFIHSLTEYADALESGDGERLFRLLEDGNRRKLEIDGQRNEPNKQTM